MVALYLNKYYKQKLVLEHYTVAIVSKNIKPLKSLGRSLTKHLELDPSDRLFITSTFLAGTERTFSSSVQLAQSYYQVLWRSKAGISKE